tara:strand:- start:339 stop:683 length:345 start_codon:yes stop_codon:yes gene_type:complete
MLNNQDFTIYQKGGNVYSIGMKFDNFIRKANLPAMIGGGKKMHATSLGLPIGLALMNRQIGAPKYHNLHSRSIEGGVLKEEIYSKLLQLAEQRPTTNSKTRKRRKKKRRKTRKL